MRRDEDFFGDDELHVIHVSRRLAVARRVEAALTDAGLDYVVRADTYPATVLFVIPTERVGAYFYVRAGDAQRARELLRGQRFAVAEAELE